MQVEEVSTQKACTYQVPTQFGLNASILEREHDLQHIDRLPHALVYMPALSSDRYRGAASLAQSSSGPRTPGLADLREWFAPERMPRTHARPWLHAPLTALHYESPVLCRSPGRQAGVIRRKPMVVEGNPSKVKNGVARYRKGRGRGQGAPTA